MKTVLITWSLLGLLLLWLIFGSSDTLLSASQPPTPTPQGIYGVLLDNNSLIYCQIVQQPIDPIFQTATAFAQTTLTVTKTPQATWTAVPSSTTVSLPTTTPSLATVSPTQEIAVTPSPSPLTMTTTAALNLRECAGTSCKVLLVIPINRTVTVFSERQLIGTVQWRRVSFEGTVGWVSEAFLK